MIDGWVATSVGECLDPSRPSGSSTIPAGEYKRQGRFPIVDQGAREIAGWTDDDGSVISDGLPLIVFGDHTRALKYVDFPFVRGADGTQLLRAKKGIDALFLYYACRAIDLPSRGYNRHFSMLREQDLILPSSIDEQREIAGALRMVERVMQHQEIMWATARELKRSTMSQLFTRGPTTDALTPTEIGDVPLGWALDPLGAHHTVATGGTPARRNLGYWQGGTIPWVKTAEVSYATIYETEERITDEAVSESSVKIFPVGTILLAMYGQGVTRGKVAKLGIDAACNQACAAIQSSDGVIGAAYLYHFLEWQYENIRSRAHGGQQQNLNLDIVRTIPIAYPKDVLGQQQIADLLDAIDVKVDLHRNRRQVVAELFSVLLRQLTAGGVRVSDLGPHDGVRSIGTTEGSVA